MHVRLSVPRRALSDRPRSSGRDAPPVGNADAVNDDSPRTPAESPAVWGSGDGRRDGRSNAPDLIRIDASEPKPEVTRIERDEEPERRSSGSGVVLDGVVWFGFGNNATGAMTDLVTWSPGN